MVDILITDPVDDLLLTSLKDAGFTIREDLDLADEHDLIHIIKNVDAIIIRSRTVLTREVIVAADRLKIIARPGVALNNVDLKAAEEKGITVINSPEAPTRSVAELVIGSMFALARHIPYANDSIKRSQWIKTQLMGIELQGKTLGILGYGRIGQEVARMGRALDMRVVASRIKEKDSERAQVLGILAINESQVLSESDFISVHIPLRPENRNYLDYNKIKLMKPTSFIINTSRGEVIDEQALLKALNTNMIAGAALDVFSEEPPKSKNIQELAAHPKVIATPHIGAQTHEALEANSKIIAQKLIKLLQN